MTGETSTGNEWFLPLGSARRDGCEALVDDSVDGWQHTGPLVSAYSVHGGQSEA